MGGMLAPIGAYSYMGQRELGVPELGSLPREPMHELGCAPPPHLQYIHGFEPQPYGTGAALVMQQQQHMMAQPHAYEGHDHAQWVARQPLPAVPATVAPAETPLLAPRAAAAPTPSAEGEKAAAPVSLAPAPTSARIDMTESLRALGLEPTPYRAARLAAPPAADDKTLIGPPTCGSLGAALPAQCAEPPPVVDSISIGPAAAPLSQPHAPLNGGVIAACLSCEPALPRAGKDKIWAAMSHYERAAARVLGWTAAAWDAGERAPTCAVPWTQLSGAERRAAADLGFYEAEWDVAIVDAATLELDGAERLGDEEHASLTFGEREALGTLANMRRAHPTSHPPNADGTQKASLAPDAPPPNATPPDAVLLAAAPQAAAQPSDSATPHAATSNAVAPASFAVPPADQPLPHPAAARAPATTGNRPIQGCSKPAQAPASALMPRAIPATVGSVLRVRTVVLHKPSRESKLGVSLRGDGGAPPTVSASSGVAAAAGLRVGEAVLSINGKQVDDHETATSIMRAAHGNLRLRVAAERDNAPLSTALPVAESAAATRRNSPCAPMTRAPSTAPATAPVPTTTTSTSTSSTSAPAAATVIAAATAPVSLLRSSFVTLHKTSSTSAVGIRLVGKEGMPPYVAQLTPGAASVAAAMGTLGLKVGQALLSVNGVPVRSAETATAMLTAAVGRIELELGDEEEDEPRTLASARSTRARDVRGTTSRARQPSTASPQSVTALSMMRGQRGAIEAVPVKGGPAKVRTAVQSRAAAVASTLLQEVVLDETASEPAVKHSSSTGGAAQRKSKACKGTKEAPLDMMSEPVPPPAAPGSTPKPATPPLAHAPAVAPPSDELAASMPKATTGHTVAGVVKTASIQSLPAAMPPPTFCEMLDTQPPSAPTAPPRAAAVDLLSTSPPLVRRGCKGRGRGGGRRGRGTGRS